MTVYESTPAASPHGRLLAHLHEGDSLLADAQGDNTSPRWEDLYREAVNAADTRDLEIHDTAVAARTSSHAALGMALGIPLLLLALGLSFVLGPLAGGIVCAVVAAGVAATAMAWLRSRGGKVNTGERRLVIGPRRTAEARH